MQIIELEQRVSALRCAISALIALPCSTPEENFATDLKVIDLEFEAQECEDYLARLKAWEGIE